MRTNKEREMTIIQLMKNASRSFGKCSETAVLQKYIKTLQVLPETDFIHHHGFYFGNYPELSDSDLEVLTNCLTKN